MFTQFILASLLFATPPQNAVETIADKAAAEDRFSGVVMLARDGRPIFSKAYGEGIRPDTKFNLGSINKIFTQVAIAQLVSSGKLALTDTIREHLSGYPSAVADKITIQQLIDHRSGLGDFFGPEFLAAPPNSIRSLSDYLPLFVNKPLLFEPGSDQRYSNAGYIVLGLIIERVSGQSYYDYVRDHIFRPLGMRGTGSYAIDENVPNRATGLTRRGPEGPLPQRQSNAKMMPGRGSSAGGGYATAPDLLRFTEGLQSGKLLTREWTDWVMKGGRLTIAGGSPGVNGVVALIPPYTMIVLSNYDPPSAESIFEQSRSLLGDRAETRRRPEGDEPGEVLIRGKVDLSISFDSHVPTIELAINSKGPYRFAIDSGFGGLMEIRPSLAEELKLQTIRAATSEKADGIMRTLLAESVDIGPLHFGEVPIGETKHSEMLQIDGVIGLRLFQGFLVTFDYPASRFRVSEGSLPAADGKNVLSYTTENGVPTINIDVQGQILKADIDSGSPAEVSLPLSAARNLPLDGQPEAVGRARTPNGETTVFRASLNGNVHVGNITLAHPSLDFLDLYPVGNLGARFLRTYAVTFDPANKRVQFGNGK